MWDKARINLIAGLTTTTGCDMTTDNSSDRASIVNTKAKLSCVRSQMRRGGAGVPVGDVGPCVLLGTVEVIVENESVNDEYVVYQ
jgi:hypothetical protein